MCNFKHSTFTSHNGLSTSPPYCCGRPYIFPLYLSISQIVSSLMSFVAFAKPIITFHYYSYYSYYDNVNAVYVNYDPFYVHNTTIMHLQGLLDTFP
jgi:hypothetical protein